MDLSFFEDSSPENRELVGVIRELGRLLPGSAEVDWQESRARCSEVLGELIESSPESGRLISMLKGADYFVGGDEHHVVRVDSQPHRVYKFTHGDNFGCRSYFSEADPDLLGHFHGETNADPFFYLKRWVFLNQLGGYQTRFEGFVPAERPHWLPRICISQPELSAPNPTPEQIRRSLAEYNFVEVSEAAFFNPVVSLLLTDAAPRNVRVIDGVPVPFDAIAQIPTGRVLDWCRSRANPPTP